MLKSLARNKIINIRIVWKVSNRQPFMFFFHNNDIMFFVDTVKVRNFIFKMIEITMPCVLYKYVSFMFRAQGVSVHHLESFDQELRST
jgi:hypothetical protein